MVGKQLMLSNLINGAGIIIKADSFPAIGFCAPDEIRTHIDGTGNHNSIH